MAKLRTKKSDTREAVQQGRATRSRQHDQSCPKLLNAMHEGTGDEELPVLLKVEASVLSHGRPGRKVAPGTLMVILEKIGADYRVRMAPDASRATWHPSRGVKFKPHKRSPWLWVTIALWGMSLAVWFSRSFWLTYFTHKCWLLVEALRVCAAALL